MSQSIHNKNSRTFIRPTQEEEARINAAIELDSDTFLPTDRELQSLRPFRGRPALDEAEKKVRISIRIEPAVASYFKAKGKGWQTRMNEALKDYIAKH